jgi:hypothetical protein
MNPYLELLPIVADRGWEIRPSGVIRDRDSRCPLCALANEIDHTILYIGAYPAALKRAGLMLLFEAHSVATAADRTNHPLRNDLMAALGMTK